MRQEDTPNVHTKIEVEFMKHGVVGGAIYLFNNNWMEQYEDEELDDWAITPDNKLADESYQIVDGEWHHFGKIVLVYENGKECYGFFNGSFYIGEWHPNTVQYLTMKLQNGMKLQRSSSVLSAYSECSNLSDDDADGNEEANGQVAASKMRNYYEQRSKNRLGHFEFTLSNMEGDDDQNGKTEKMVKRQKSRLVQNGRGGVMSVHSRDDEDNDDENDEDMMLHRHRSLDTDDEDEEEEEVDGMEVEQHSNNDVE